MKIIQITDTHLLGKKGKLFGINVRFNFKKALKSIRKNHANADFIIITGDLTNNGTKEAFDELKDLIKKFPIPIHLILGNHDSKNVFNETFDLCKDDDFVQYSFKIDNNAFIFLDSTVSNEEYGNLCKDRLAWLQSELEKYKKNNVYIFMHHFPLDSKLPWMENNAYFKDKKPFWETILKKQNVKHIFTGHLHRIVQGNYKGIGVSSIRSTNFQVAYTPNSNEDYLTTKEQPAYAVITIEEDSFIIHNHKFMIEGLIYIPSGYETKDTK